MINQLEKLGIDAGNKVQMLEKFMQIFAQYNQNVNLMSKNDVGFLFEKHIYDCLAFNLFYKKYNFSGNKLLDIGTGGGLPAVPIAVCFDNIEVTAVDSTLKKIKFIEYVKKELNLKNLYPKWSRIENMKDYEAYDIVVSRAVAELKIILEYAIPCLKTNSFFIAYKSLKADDEIKNAKITLGKLNAEIIDKIEYSLPIEEKNKRYLVIIRKKPL